MKSLVALFAATALVSPAFAQNVVMQEMQKNHRGQAATLAGKPILLHTGRPITQADKQQVMASAARLYPIRLTGARGTAKPQSTVSTTPTVVTISPTQMYQNGYVNTEAYQPYFNAGLNEFLFMPGQSSYLDFQIITKANTTYVLTYKVNSITKNPQFTILPAFLYLNTIYGAQTFNGNVGNNEFVYAFISSIAGEAIVTIYSPNATWEFTSCEITAMPIN